MLLSSFLHAGEHGAGIRVKTRAYVLDIENQRVNPSQHLRSEAARGSGIEADHGKAGRRIFGIRDIFLIFGSTQTVLRRKYRGDLDTRGQHQVDIALSIPAQAGVIGNKADPFAGEGREILLSENIQTSEDVGLRLHDPMQSRARYGLVVS